MEVPSGQEDEIPIPLNISYDGGQHGHGHGHMIHHDHHHHQPSHNHIMPSSVGAPPTGPQISTNGATPISASGTGAVPDDLHHHHHLHHFKKLVKYRECLKNHAAAMGGNATDGCGEFMPSGEEGSLEALTCSACNCHRNFHRKEVEGEIINNNNNNPCETCFHSVNPRIGVGGRKLFMGHPQAIGYHGGALISARAVAPHQMIMPYSVGTSLPSESEDQDEGGAGTMSVGRPSQLVKKRFRTKFTQEQKDKMLSFAEKVGWKIQKQEEGVVQQFCQEVGVKRRVLKVWMHNNKHSLSKKNPEPNPDQNQV